MPDHTTTTQPVAPVRPTRRSERGATTAEYVGILAFVGLLVLGVIGIVTPIGDLAKGTVQKAYCQITSTLGVSTGCPADALPEYLPDDCTLSSNSQTWGGSVSVVATVGGDTGYTIIRVRERQPDGSFKDKYIVKTQGQVSGSYEFGPKGGAEVGTGDGGVEANGGATVNINGNFTGGQTFEFGSLEDAQNFADDNAANFGGLFGTQGGVEPSSTYFEAGAGVGVSGELGPTELEANGTAVLGVESHSNGDTTFSMGLTVDAAANLGIPIPDTLLEASAAGDVELSVQANVTFDANGNVTNVTGVVAGHAEGEVNLGVNNELGMEGLEEGAPVPNGTLTDLALPNLDLDAGGQFQLEFSSNFNNENSAAFSEALGNMVTGQPMSEADAQALMDQFNNHSQVNFTIGTYDKDHDEWGGKIKTPIGSVGAEGHHTTIDQNTTGGWYYNPTTGQWEENLACS